MFTLYSTRNVTQRWLDIATRLLQAVWTAPNTAIVLVSNAQVWEVMCFITHQNFTQRHLFFFSVFSSYHTLQLVPALAKLLVFKLARFFSAQDVYSSSHDSGMVQIIFSQIGLHNTHLLYWNVLLLICKSSTEKKQQCFERIKRRFPSSQFIVIGDGLV